MPISNTNLNILVTGANGQLGHCIQDRASKFPQLHLFFTDIDTLDITNKAAVEAYLNANCINRIINCAAYTAVDKAEEQVALCTIVNTDAPRILGEAAMTCGASVIHVSTDYVFDGSSCRPYQETDTTCPISVYGRSKQAGEEALMVACSETVIVRTAWLYSEHGSNFMKTMLHLGAERESLNVIADQVGTPTYAGDLAETLLAIAQTDKMRFTPGIYHYSNEGVCSWYDFATKIMQAAKLNCKVNPIETKDYPTPATRPHYSVLNKAKIKSTYGICIPHWEASLVRIIQN